MGHLLQILISAALAFGAVGQPAPEFSAKTLSGETVSPATTKDKVVVIHFWATWCKPCMLEMPALSAYYKKHGKEGLVVLAVSMDKSGDLDKAKAMSRDFSFPIALNSDANFKKFGRIWHMPMTFLIDRHGILREDDWKAEGVDQSAYEQALEKTVTPLLTK